MKDNTLMKRIRACGKTQPDLVEELALRGISIHRRTLSDAFEGKASPNIVKIMPVVFGIIGYWEIDCGIKNDPRHETRAVNSVCITSAEKKRLKSVCL